MFYITEKYNLRNMVTIKLYNYSKLVLTYGPNRGATVTVQWSTNDKAFKLIFGKSKYYLTYYYYYLLTYIKCSF